MHLLFSRSSRNFLIKTQHFDSLCRKVLKTESGSACKKRAVLGFTYYLETCMMSANSGSSEAPPTKKPSMLGQEMSVWQLLPLTEPP